MGQHKFYFYVLKNVIRCETLQMRDFFCQNSVAIDNVYLREEETCEQGINVVNVSTSRSSVLLLISAVGMIDCGEVLFSVASGFQCAPNDIVTGRVVKNDCAANWAIVKDGRVDCAWIIRSLVQYTDVACSSGETSDGVTKMYERRLNSILLGYGHYEKLNMTLLHHYRP